MRRTIATPLALLLTLLPAAGSAQVVLGAVYESGTGRPVSGTFVALVDSSGRGVLGALTDSLGTVLLQAPRPGRYDVTVRRIGFRLLAPVTVQLGSGDVVDIDLPLVAVQLELDPVIVSAEGATPRRLASFERRRTGRGFFLDEQAIKDKNPVLVTDALRGVPRLEVLRAGAERTWTVRFRNRRVATRVIERNCGPEIYVNDGYVGDADIWLNRIVQPENLIGIEVYHTLSEMPGEFRTRRASCGVIVLWTRAPGTQGN